VETPVQGSTFQARGFHQGFHFLGSTLLLFHEVPMVHESCAWDRVGVFVSSGFAGNALHKSQLLSDPHCHSAPLGTSGPLRARMLNTFVVSQAKGPTPWHGDF
jgi:hypothetical protein